MNTAALETNYQTVAHALHTLGKTRRILGRADCGKLGNRAQVKGKQQTEV
ncbi:MAG TPA: hypothetical protein VFZ59_03580 [Verrucomicrobiae bacterium]|nr:hypothetical protein [Verrucomicrobiae bacterium]